MKIGINPVILNNPSSIHISYATGYTDCIYIADTDNNTILFVPININGQRRYGKPVQYGEHYNDNTIEIDYYYIIAGNGTAGFNMEEDGKVATNAKLNKPTSVVTDSSGNLYIADTGNHRIRKVDTNGIITTIAGSFKDYSYSFYTDIGYQPSTGRCEDTQAHTDHYGTVHHHRPQRSSDVLRCKGNLPFSGEIGGRPNPPENESSANEVYIESPTTLKILESHHGDGDPIKYLYFLTKDSVCRIHIEDPIDKIDNPSDEQEVINPSPLPDTISKLPVYHMSLAKDLLYYLNENRDIGETEDDIQNPEPLKIKRIAFDYDGNMFYTIGNAVLRQLFIKTDNLVPQGYFLSTADIPVDVSNNGGMYHEDDDPNIMAGEYTVDDINENIIYSDKDYLGEGRRPTFAQLDNPTNVAVDNSGNLLALTQSSITMIHVGILSYRHVGFCKSGNLSK
jgi:hypothetical protein